MKVDDFDNQYQ